MKDLEIVFNNDMELCYDGVTPRQYKAGKTYSPTHAHERKMFEAFLADGRASLPGEKKADEKVETEKVVTPKATKKSKKSK